MTRGKSARRVGATGKKDSRIRPNKGGVANKHVVPAMYKFKYPSVATSYVPRGAAQELDKGAQGGGMMGMNLPDNQVRVSGRKGVKRSY